MLGYSQIGPLAAVMLAAVLLASGCAHAGEAEITAAPSRDAATFDDVAFLTGAWRGGDGDFVFEETWNAAEGGVMTGMARGVSDNHVRVLEYILISRSDSGLVMLFKHFNVDYSTWETAGPITLPLIAFTENDVTLAADPASETVKSIRYWKPADETLQADIVIVEDGEEDSFSLTFERVSN